MQHSTDDIGAQLAHARTMLADYDFRLATTIWNDADMSRLSKARDRARNAVMHHQHELESRLTSNHDVA